MELVYSMGGIVDARKPRRDLARMKDAGMMCVCVPFGMGLYPAPDPPLHPERQKRTILPMPGMDRTLAEMNACGMKMAIASAPGIGRMEWPKKPEALAHAKRCKTDEERLEEIEQLVTASIELCGQAGCHKLIVWPLLAHVEEERLREVNRAYYLRLARVAKAQDVQILLVNGLSSFRGHVIRGFLADAHEMCDAVDELNAEAGEARFGCAFHPGLASLCGQDVGEWIRIAGGRLQAVFLSETDGHAASCLPLLYGGARLPWTQRYQTDWLSIVRALRAIAFDGALVLEFAETYALVPLMMREALLTLARKAGEYLLWQVQLEQALARYPQRVLFGAGRMCHRYLTAYGEAYPPLFTCDNDPKTWGKEIDGLPIRSPEALRDLPEGCAVFLCNQYYDEVEAQIRSMGLTCPIERFNDEFLPQTPVDFDDEEMRMIQ